MASRVSSLHGGAACRALHQRLAAALPPAAASQHGPGRRRQLSHRPCAQQEQQPQVQQQQDAGAEPSSTAAAPELAGASRAAAGGAAASKHMDGRLYAYLQRHTREPAVLAALRADTASRYPSAAHMAVSPDQGAFLAWLAHTLRARRVIEVGVFSGYSSVALALALPPDGTLLACDRDPRALEVAARHWAAAGVAGRVRPALGPAAATLDALLADPAQHGSYDFAFVDADKKGYRGYYEQLLRLVRPGGVIAIDNVLWYGRVADPADDSGATRALRDLNAFLLADERVVFSLAPVGDGLALCTKR